MIRGSNLAVIALLAGWPLGVNADPPAPVPAPTPPPAAESPAPPPPDPTPFGQVMLHQARREALTLYGLAILQQRNDRLIEATRSLEAVIQLDPQAVPPRQLLIPLYSALGRPDEAARIAATVVLLDPTQAETWRTLAKLMQDLGRPADAISVLHRCVASPQMADRTSDLLDAYRELGRLYAGIGGFAQSAQAYRKAIELTKVMPAIVPASAGISRERAIETAELHEGLAAACLGAQDFHAALTAALEARDGFRRVGQIRRAERQTPRIAAAYAGLNESGRALEMLESYLSQKPRDRDAGVLYARLLRDAGQGNAVPAKLAQWVEADPEDVPLRVLYGEELRRSGNRAAAETAFLDAIERQPDVSAYRGLVGLLSGPGGSPSRLLDVVDQSVRRSQPAEGEAKDPRAVEQARALTEALKQEPAASGIVLVAAVNELQQSRRARPREGPRSPATWWLLAGLAERAGQLRMAEELLRGAMSAARPDQEADLYVALIRVLRQARKRAEIVALCQQGLDSARGTSRVLFHFHLTRNLAQMGRVEEALKNADEAIRLAGKDRLTMCLSRIDALTFAERFEEAESAAKALFQEFTRPDEVRRIRHELSRTYTAARKSEQSEEQLRLILELDPTDASAHNSLGYELAERGQQLEDAERLIRRALELDRTRKSDSLEEESENAAYLDSLGWVLFRRGRLPEARQWLERAAALVGGMSDPVVWDHLGDVRARQDQPAEALAAWERARELYRTEKRTLRDPRGAEVERKIQHLQAGRP